MCCYRFHKGIKMADSFAEALLKVGLTSKDEVDKINKEKKEQEKAKQKEVEPQEHVEQKPQETQLPQLPEIQKFIDMWNDERAHKFLVHLIYAYTPFSAGYFAWTDDELHEKKCCMCKCKLMSKDAIFQKMPEITTLTLQHMREEINGTLTSEKFRADFSAITGDRILGIVSEKSKAAMCSPCFNGFVRWVQESLLRGNNEVNRIIHRRMLEISKEHENAAHENAV